MARPSTKAVLIWRVRNRRLVTDSSFSSWGLRLNRLLLDDRPRLWMLEAEGDASDEAQSSKPKLSVLSVLSESKRREEARLLPLDEKEVLSLGVSQR